MALLCSPQAFPEALDEDPFPNRASCDHKLFPKVGSGSLCSHFLSGHTRPVVLNLGCGSGFSNQKFLSPTHGNSDPARWGLDFTVSTL